MSLYTFGGHSPDVAAEAWIAPSADLIGAVVVGAGASVWFNAVVRADNSAITIGPRSSVQECAVLHSDVDAPCSIGADSTIGHHAMLHGCTIGDRVIVGMRATVLDRSHIGEDSIVGAGALVTGGKIFPPGHLILGSPAKPVRRLTDEEIRTIRHSAEHYVARAAAFATTMIECR